MLAYVFLWPFLIVGSIGGVYQNGEQLQFFDFVGSSQVLEDFIGFACCRV